MKRWFRFGDIMEDENITPEMIAKVIEDGRKIAREFKNTPLINKETDYPWYHSNCILYKSY